MTKSVPVSSPEIQALFNRIAPIYDQFNNYLSLGQHQVWKWMTVKWSEAKTGDRTLDLCCGTGDLTRILAKQVGNSGEAWGVDFAPELLAIARQKTPPHLPIHWLEADVLTLPFPDNHFAAATMGYGLRNVTDIPQALQEIQRVLQPGAKVAILDFHRPQDPFWSWFQKIYLDFLVVPFADACGLKSEYAYINPSLQRFPTGSEQVKIAEELGFSQAIHYPIAAGMMGVLVLTK